MVSAVIWLSLRLSVCFQEIPDYTHTDIYLYLEAAHEQPPEQLGLGTLLKGTSVGGRDELCFLLSTAKHTHDSGNWICGLTSLLLYTLGHPYVKR